MTAAREKTNVDRSDHRDDKKTSENLNRKGIHFMLIDAPPPPALCLHRAHKHSADGRKRDPGMNVNTSATSPVEPASRADALVKPPRAPTGPLIYQTIVDLANSNRIATRSVLMGATGLSYSVIDDHVKRMIDEGRVRRVMNGVFETVPPSPEDRAVSITHLPGGGCKLEMGDWCSDVSMREMRMIAMATAGVSLQFGDRRRAWRGLGMLKHVEVFRTLQSSSAPGMQQAMQHHFARQLRCTCSPATALRRQFWFVG